MELPPLVTSLMRPGSIPPFDPAPATLIQTHISYIILTSQFAYKIKKPVDFGFLDFTTLEKRLRACTDEVRLNRRLAPGVYLGVVKITEAGGGFVMKEDGEGGGEAIEYAVKMRRIPEESMLDKRLAAGRVSAADIVRVAGAIASFHESADSGGRISSFGAPETVGANAAENFSQTFSFVGGTISKGLYDRIKTYSNGFLKEHRELFLERVSGGRIRDCHGDLRCEHISLDGGVQAIDCIEFNERFRFSDTISDAAFLSMDLDRRGRHDLSLAFDEAYLKESGDEGGARLLGFYRCYRAYVRGKVDSFKSAEQEVGTDEREAVAMSAALYFHLSGLYASGGYRPMMVVVRGLSGTGKSTVASALAERTGCFTVLSSDRVRKELAGTAPGRSAPAAFEEGIYTPEFTARTYAELFKRAASLLSAGRPVILDATFSKAAFIEKAKETADAAGALFHVVECVCGDGAIRERLEKRSRAPSLSDAGWDVYLKQKKRFEQWSGPMARIDTAGPQAGLTAALVREIFD